MNNSTPPSPEHHHQTHREKRLAHFQRRQATSPQAATFLRISRWITAISLLACAAFVIYGFLTGIFHSVPALRDFLDRLGILAPLGYIGLCIAQAIFPILPGGITVIAAPVLFGAVKGSIYAYLGTVIGSIGAFLIGRQLGMDVLRARFSPKTLDKYLGWLTHPHYTRYFAIAIAMPVAPDDFLCYLSGLTTMRLRTFSLIIILLKPWSILAYSFGVLALINLIFPGIGA
ncbi:TVP38/TMEM64 family protein [Dermatophilus congolensis]|uniref:TVP38/TMEM64 family membrane protein n=1 Tax=Dermatophilus congolensis TaxID=1863 RepID=A0A239V7M2_9MICO|nr:TVP38/TMEM64 family protein [Dermatophilus congolensis]MBO3130449.1 TVP38/TMEM64 family protein [Dermatophilus congolensis]MBO3130920.1 TVP38/TMEM64 family protein [Dermatophilus congolensis]MBO3134921.1 TVP38/TMEM64 family protein [Dermatophilus congolensis]MBO3137160.1 TVP38/TMEM64 family protein [Dermatophilus congolensis]MBO3139403.1 TVP38/TMEM64 family protein [Dermatophilus congolensis]